MRNVCVLELLTIRRINENGFNYQKWELQNNKLFFGTAF